MKIGKRRSSINHPQLYHLRKVLAVYVGDGQIEVSVNSMTIARFVSVLHSTGSGRRRRPLCLEMTATPSARLRANARTESARGRWEPPIEPGPEAIQEGEDIASLFRPVRVVALQKVDDLFQIRLVAADAEQGVVRVRQVLAVGSPMLLDHGHSGGGDRTEAYKEEIVNSTGKQHDP